MIFSSSWFSEKIQLFYRNPLRFKVPHESRDDVSEIERENEREDFLTRGVRGRVVNREIKDFEIGSFANATCIRSMWLSLFTL